MGHEEIVTYFGACGCVKIEDSRIRNIIEAFDSSTVSESTNEVDSSGMGSIPSSQKMAGITWNNMPTMPRKRKSESERMKFRKFDASGQPLSALQELADAQKELQTAIAEWTKQLGAFPDLTEGNDDGVNWE